MRKQFKWKNVWKKRKQKFFKLYKKLSDYLKKNKLKWFFLIWFISISFIFFVVLKLTIFHPQYTISTVSFSQQNIDDFDDFEMYTYFQNSILNQNYFTTKYLNIKSIFRDVRSNYPLLKDVNIILNWQNSVFVEFEFHEPTFFFVLDDRNIIYYWGNFFDLFSWSSIWSEMFKIELPSYLYDIYDFEWFFFKVDPATLRFQLDEIIKFIWLPYIKNIKYIPWASRIVLVDTSDTILYFNNLRSISDQLNKYYTLLNNYVWYWDVWEIDLWSNDDIIVKSR